MKQVAILHYAAPPVVGGVESTIGDHARLLAQRGYGVRIIAGRAGRPDGPVQVSLLALADSRHPRVLAAQAELAGGLVSENFQHLVADLSSDLGQALQGCNVCIAHNINTLHKNLALTAALHTVMQRSTLRLIAWCHDFAWTDPLYAPVLHSGWPWDLLRTPWPRARYVVVSQSRRTELASLLGLAESEIAVVTPGISPAHFLGLGKQAVDWMDRLALWEARPLILLPARVTRRKNIELAVRITAALRQQGMLPKLLVMGPLGPHNPANAAYLHELKHLSGGLGVPQDVIFLQEHGRVSNAARRDLYLLADLMLFPSEREGFGIPILEAGLTRLPVFCSDIPPFRESGDNDVHFFYLHEDPAEIAARISAFLVSEPTVRLRARVLRCYAWPRIMQSGILPLIEDEERQP